MVLLAGCFSDQSAQMAKCHLEAQAKWPNEADFRQVDTYAELCMKAAGYNADHSVKLCQVNFSTLTGLSLNPHCYVPAGRVSYWLDRMEMYWDGRN